MSTGSLVVVFGFCGISGSAVVDLSLVANFEHWEVVGGLDERGVTALDPRSGESGPLEWSHKRGVGS